MIERLLSLVGYAAIDLNAVARALAGRLLADYDAANLDKRGTMDYLRTRYMRLVADYGLPARVCVDVANRAWALIEQARGDADDSEQPTFAFYDD